MTDNDNGVDAAASKDHGIAQAHPSAAPVPPEPVACIRPDDRDKASTWGTIYYVPGTADFRLTDTTQMVDVCLLSDALALHALCVEQAQEIAELRGSLVAALGRGDDASDAYWRLCTLWAAARAGK